MNANQHTTSAISRIGQHHSFDVDLAAELKSVELAILVHHFQFWIRHNAAMGMHLHEGLTWTYQTLKDIASHFPYWSHKQIERMINKLIELDILVKGNFNQSAYDRTVWYAFKNQEKFSISRNREMDLPKSGNQDPEIGTPIPDTLPYKKKKKREAEPSIEFDYDAKEFVNIQPSDHEDWSKLYPGIDIDHELGKMRQWLMDPSNPERDGNRTFITNWLSRAKKSQPKAAKNPTESSSDTPKGHPYNPSIAYAFLNNRGVDAYVEYLKTCRENKYYNNHLNGKYEQIYIDYLEEQGNE